MECDEEIEEGQACDYALPPRARASDFNWMKGIKDRPTDNFETPQFLKDFVKKYFKWQKKIFLKRDMTLLCQQV
jgi:hypothetical protein